ncbi:D-alanyl-D-alanine carboxypeptidase [Streptomyces sp. NPDC050625]|uniref:D-alanyl-D-alanine carboxypeptidase n=1 Tax=Streptomyces sp. NPDC050625 TaxID=3154629 RepID=UPI00343F3BF8
MEEASVAGESPDKSKQRESSAEPTPGSGGPVPEARDPRLAVSRRTADTATRVLSVRDVPATAGGPEQEAEDSRLRAAVATWVRTGGSAGSDEEAQANSEDEGARSTARADSEGEEARSTAQADSKAKGEGGSAAADAETEDDEAAEADSAPEDARSSAQAGSEAKAGETAAGSKTEDEARADSDGEDEQGAAQSGSEVTGEDGSAADAKARGEGRSATVDTEAEDDEAAGRDDSEPEDARGTAQADAEAKAGETAAGSKTEDEARADSDGGDGRGAAQRQTDSEPEDARSTAQADTEAKASETAAGSEAESEAHADSEPEDARGTAYADSEAKASKAAAGSKTEDEARADSDGGDGRGAAQRQTDSEPEDARSTAYADSEAKASKAAAGSATEDEARADSEPEDARGAAQADSKGGEAPEAGDGGEGERSGAEGAALKAADAEPVSVSKADAGAKGSAPKSTPGPRTPRDPRAADGEDAPQGPPAPKDESRTGGAGGNRTAEGGAEAAPKPPVGHPTAVFKAPRPKPQVDQPTTMLKLGGTQKPKPSEPAEAERTSKFVALKPLDAPATRTPNPPAQAQADVTTAIPQVGPERTTQQPLPPKPPLDLLAELTNTPPPPETPVRTIVRRVKIWTPLVVLLVIVFAVVQAMRPLPTPTLALTAEESYQFEGGKVTLPWPAEGQGWMDVDGIGTMDSFGKQTPVAIGSVAKTMTAYIVLKDHPLKAGEEGPTITVDATAEKEGGYDKAGESTLNSIKAGDKLTLKQALSAVMIPSANNIARLLARWDAGGSEAAFVKKMNATAKELGMSATTYTDPSGLKETTVSTAGDQVKLGNAVVKVPALVAITSAASWKDPSGHNWPNYNQLPYLVGAIGIKTGSTTAAGGNLLFAARKKVGGETVTVVGAILGQHKPSILDTVNAVSKTALLAAEDALTSAKTLKKGDVVGYVDDGLDGHTPVVVTEDVTAVGWAGLKVKLSFAADTVPHTAKAGTKVGTLTVGDGKSGAVQVPVALQKDLTEPGFGSKLTRLG